MNITAEDLKDYYRQLENHDWFYTYSDDGRVYTEGLRERGRLLSYTVRHPRFQELYRQFADWIYKKRATKPEIPE